MAGYMNVSTYPRTSANIVLYTYGEPMHCMSSLESKAAIARPDSKSLRATVPEGIVAFLGLETGDTLNWRMDFKNGERVVEVRKGGKKK
jgi:hypothetical protein